MWIHLKRLHYPILIQYQPTWSILTVWQYFSFGLSLNKGHLLCSIDFEHPKMRLKYILKVIKNATGTSLIFPINISLIHFVVVLTSVPNVGGRYTKT